MLKTYNMALEVIGEAVNFFVSRGYEVRIIPVVKDTIGYTGQPIRQVDYYKKVEVEAPENVHEEYRHHYTTFGL